MHTCTHRNELSAGQLLPVACRERFPEARDLVPYTVGTGSFIKVLRCRVVGAWPWRYALSQKFKCVDCSVQNRKECSLSSLGALPCQESEPLHEAAVLDSSLRGGWGYWIFVDHSLGQTSVFLKPELNCRGWICGSSPGWLWTTLRWIDARIAVSRVL